MIGTNNKNDWDRIRNTKHWGRLKSTKDWDTNEHNL